VPHLFVQFFDGMTGKPLFNVVNTIMFVLLLHLLVITVTRAKGQYYKTLTLAVAFIMLLMPGFNLAFLWMSGACNYLWTSVFLLSFNLILQKDIQAKRPYVLPLLFCIGLVCGWTHEGLVIGLLAGYIFHYSFNRKELTATRIVLLSGFALGVLFMLVSPANFNRAMKGMSGLHGLGIIMSYVSALLAMSNLRIFFILLLGLALTRICKREAFKAIVHDNSVWLVAAFVSFAFIVFTRHASTHSRFGIELFSLIIVLRFLLRIKIPQALCSFCNILMVVFLTFAVQSCRTNYKEYLSQIAQIENKENHIIQKHELGINKMFHRFIVHSPCDVPTCAWIANYFHRDDAFVFRPSTFIDDIRRNPNHYERFHTNKELPFYAKRLKKGEAVGNVKFLLRETRKEEIPFYYLHFIDKLERFTALEIAAKYEVVNVLGESYLVVYKHELPEIDNRVIDISYTNGNPT